MRAALLEGPPLRLAALFGSRARGAIRDDSDVDVGIIPMDPRLSLSEELALQDRLSHACGLEVDLVRLDGDDLLIGREVARHGIALFEDRPGAFARFRAEAISRWLDFDVSAAGARRRFLERLAAGGRS